MQTKDISIKGEIVKGYQIDLPNARLIAIVAKNGYLMCGYLNIEASDKFNDCAAVVKGVSSIDELLSKEVSAVSSAAMEKGIKPGMLGFNAISLMI